MSQQLQNCKKEILPSIFFLHHQNCKSKIFHNANWIIRLSLSQSLLIFMFIISTHVLSTPEKWQNTKLYILVMNFSKTLGFFPCAEKIQVNLVIFLGYGMSYFFPPFSFVSYFIKLTLNSWNYFQGKGDQDSTPKTSTNKSFSKYYKKIFLIWFF